MVSSQSNTIKGLTPPPPSLPKTVQVVPCFFLEDRSLVVGVADAPPSPSPPLPSPPPLPTAATLSVGNDDAALGARIPLLTIVVVVVFSLLSSRRFGLLLSVHDCCDGQFEYGLISIRLLLFDISGAKSATNGSAFGDGSENKERFTTTQNKQTRDTAPSARERRNSITISVTCGRG